MDAGANKSQPSNFVLFATALLCGATLMWAYRDRDARQAAAAEATDAAEVRTPAAPPEVVWNPQWEQVAVGRVADPPAVSLLPPVPTRGVVVAPLGPPELAPPASTPSGPSFAADAEDIAPWLPDAEELQPAELDGPDLSADAFEAPAPNTSASAPWLKPGDLATKEHTVLVDAPQPTPAAARPTPAKPAPVEYENPFVAEEAPRVAAQPSPDITPVTPRDFYEDDLAAYAAEVPRDELLTYTPSASDISQRVQSDVQAAFALGRHGALFAARARFVDAMRTIALARDAEQSTDRYSRALDQGLLALEEAQDFLPGGAVSKELTVAEVAASHQTPMLRNHQRAEWALPQEAAGLYYRYAEQKLASAVSGEQAGSMALYGLGKTYDRLAEVEQSSADQQLSLAMHRAALTAHDGNHMAANELGVGLAKVGRYEKAAVALQQSITSGGGSTVYRNLAHVQHKLGQTRLAAETSQQAERLAMAERSAGEFSRDRGVQWVPPTQLARQSSPAGAPPQPTVAAAPAQPTAQPPVTQPRQASTSPLGGVKRFAKRIWSGSPEPAAQPTPPAMAPAGPAPTNRVAAPVRSQTTFR